MPLTNWARNVIFDATTLHRPTSLDALRRLVAGTGRLRALGTGHSFNRIADSPGDLVSVRDLPRRLEITPGAAGRPATATVSAGWTYGELAARLHAHGYALANLGSLPHISIAGACATGTHGSGDGNGNLATSVSAIEFVTATGDLASVARRPPLGTATDPDPFEGCVVALGSLGITTTLTLDLLPTFDVAQQVFEHLPGDSLRTHFDEITAAAYSVSLFTRWREDVVEQVWRKRTVTGDGGPPGDGTTWFGATPATGERHPIPGIPATHCTRQLGVPGPWYERLPHFRLEFTPSAGEELQSEYLLPRRHAVAALDAVAALRDTIAPVLLISEVRTVAGDQAWLSPSYRRDSVAVHFTWVKDEAAVRPVLEAVEDALAPYDARPHWGKLFAERPVDVARRYERMPDFAALVERHDPHGKFGNALVDELLGRG